jgi:hypothetical protein
MHVTLARQLAREIGGDAISADMGAYYLGASAPDIRALTKWDRSQTHFFDLNNFDEQHGVHSLFCEHPELAAPSQLDPATTSFLCGYITHLEMDEAWITDIYRPCFGERSPLKDELLANVLDRVLQHELDRRGREELEAVQEIRDELVAATCEVAVGFIGVDDLTQWRSVVDDLLSREWTWERFGRFASRHLKPYGVESEEDLQEFMKNIPDLVDQSVQNVTPERIEAFEERSRQRALDAVREYLA